MSKPEKHTTRRGRPRISNRNIPNSRLASIALTIALATALLGGCFAQDPCDDLLDDSRQEAAACFGTWNQGEIYTDATGAYTVQWIDHDFYDPTDEWFDTCEDRAWSRDLVVIEHASGDANRPRAQDRVVYHLRRRCEWNVRCFQSDKLITDRVEFEHGTSPIPGLELGCGK